MLGHIPTDDELDRLEEIRRRAQDAFDLARVNVERAEERKRQAWNEFAAASKALNDAHSARTHAARKS